MQKKITRLIKLFISIIFFIAAWVLNIVFMVLGVKIQKSCAVLVYHSIFAEARLSFARQMDDLLKLAIPIDVSKLGKEDTQGTPVLVTFDDGFRSFRENALPELTKRKIPVVLFIPSQCLGERPRFTNNYNIKEKEIVMSPEELLSLPHDLVTIGSHCQTHPHLPLLDKDIAKKEIADSRRDLETLLGRPINLLAFPYGEYDEQILQWSREAGYKKVFSTLPRQNKKDDFLWGRIDTSPHDWLVEFKLKVAGAYRWLPWAVFLKRKAKKIFVVKTQKPLQGD